MGKSPIRNTSRVDMNMAPGTYFVFGNVDFSMGYDNNGANDQYFSLREGPSGATPHYRLYKRLVAQNTDNVCKGFISDNPDKKRLWKSR